MIWERLVFLLEEPSAETFLKTFLPHVLPEELSYIIIPHRGKSDLRKSIPHKIRAWQGPARFIVLHDQDSNDCVELKRNLQQLCEENGRNDIVIRIACRELEAWYFGDIQALCQAFPNAPRTTFERRAPFRDPDQIDNPAKQLEQKVDGFQKGKAARLIPQYMDLNQNRSKSFNSFFKAIKDVAEQIDGGG